MTAIASTGSSPTRTVTAFFDTSDHASKARTDLIQAGVAEDDIVVVGSDAQEFTVKAAEPKGFWDSLADFFMPDDDRRAYAEGLRRGGYAISVRTNDGMYERTIDVLDRDGAVDFDERELDWKAEGWAREGGVDMVVGTPYQPADASTAGFGGSFAGEDGIERITETTNPDVRERIGVGTASQTAPAPTGGPHAYTDAATPADDQASDIVEGRAGADEDGIFGKRDMTHGRTRVRSYIVNPTH